MSKIKSLTAILGIATSLLPMRADAGSVNIWNVSGSSSTASSGNTYLDHSISGLLGGDSGDKLYSDPPLGPGKTSWLKTTTDLIISGTTYNLSTDNRPSTGNDANAPYTINLEAMGNPVTSENNYLKIFLIDSANEPQSAYNVAVNLFNGAKFADGTTSKSYLWNFNDGTKSLDYYDLANVSGKYGTATFTPVPEPETLALFGIGAAVMALRRRFGKKQDNEKVLDMEQDVSGTFVKRG